MKNTIQHSATIIIEDEFNLKNPRYTLKNILDEGSLQTKQKMLAFQNYRVFRDTVRNNSLEDIKNLLEVVESEKKQTMLASNNYEAFRTAVSNNSLELINKLYDATEDKQQMINSCYSYNKHIRNLIKGSMNFSLTCKNPLISLKLPEDVIIKIVSFLNGASEKMQKNIDELFKSSIKPASLSEDAKCDTTKTECTTTNQQSLNQGSNSTSQKTEDIRELNSDFSINLSNNGTNIMKSKVVLIGEEHDDPSGAKFINCVINRLKQKHKKKPIYFLIEKDKNKLDKLVQEIESKNDKDSVVVKRKTQKENEISKIFNQLPKENIFGFEADFKSIYNSAKNNFIVALKELAINAGKANETNFNVLIKKFKFSDVVSIFSKSIPLLIDLLVKKLCVDKSTITLLIDLFSFENPNAQIYYDHKAEKKFYNNEFVIKYRDNHFTDIITKFIDNHDEGIYFILTGVIHVPAIEIALKLNNVDIYYSNKAKNLIDFVSNNNTAKINNKEGLVVDVSKLKNLIQQQGNQIKYVQDIKDIKAFVKTLISNNSKQNNLSTVNAEVGTEKKEEKKNEKPEIKHKEQSQASLNDINKTQDKLNDGPISSKDALSLKSTTIKPFNLLKTKEEKKLTSSEYDVDTITKRLEEIENRKYDEKSEHYYREFENKYNIDNKYSMLEEASMSNVNKKDHIILTSEDNKANKAVAHIEITSFAPEKPEQDVIIQPEIKANNSSFIPEQNFIDLTAKPTTVINGESDNTQIYNPTLSLATSLSFKITKMPDLPQIDFNSHDDYEHMGYISTQSGELNDVVHGQLNNVAMNWA